MIYVIQETRNSAWTRIEENTCLLNYSIQFVGLTGHVTIRRYSFVIVTSLSGFTPKQEIFRELVLNDETTSILGARYVENQFKFRKSLRRWRRYSNYNLLS